MSSHHVISQPEPVALDTIINAMVDAPSVEARALARRVLSGCGLPAAELLQRRGTRIVFLGRGERCTDRSQRLLELAPHLDAWPAPPAGLFVLEERTAYLRSRNLLAVGHEAGHAIDCALGAEGYHRAPRYDRLRIQRGLISPPNMRWLDQARTSTV